MLRHRWPPPRQSFRIGAITFALDERTLDMVLGDKSRNGLLQWLGHWYRFHDIGAGFGHRFAFGRIRCHRSKLVRWIAIGRPQDDPKQRGFHLEVVAIMRGFGP